MAREVTLLIPDELCNEPLDIKVFVAGKEMLVYKLELLEFNEKESDENRADFVKKSINKFPQNYLLTDVGLDANGQIPVLFQINNL